MSGGIIRFKSKRLHSRFGSYTAGRAAAVLAVRVFGHRRKRSGGCGQEFLQIAFAETFEKFPEIGDKQGADNCVYEHSEHHGCAERYAACRTGSGGEQHGHYSEYECERSHHDGTETYASRLLRRTADIHSRASEINGILDNEYRVLCREPEQKYYADLGVDAYALSHEQASRCRV